ncbi:hypothetical protein AT267_14595 [Bacillus cereus]|nr:metallophosphoesterase [Bacillus cereus]KXY29116.1 hypothetical protein AT267_14595 [Bacillus cereus]
MFHLHTKKHLICMLTLMFFAGLFTSSCMHLNTYKTKKAYGNENGVFVITSDPQYPWTDKTDEGNFETDIEKEIRSAQMIKEQYNSINEYNDRKSTLAHVLINGDLTSFGYIWQLRKMQSLLSTLKSPFSFGLGNHDIENNFWICRQCVHRSLSMYLAYTEMLPTKRFDRTIRFTSNSTQQLGSFSYSLNFGPIHSIQLNINPTMKFDVSAKNGKLTYTIDSNLNWLEEDLKEAYRDGQVIIINMHKPNKWKNGPNQRFIDLLKKYDVKAVFAGHYHKYSGVYNFKKYFGDVPVFLSGSASQQTYLIAEYDTNINQMKVYKVSGNNWREKSLIKIVDIKNHSNYGSVAKFFEWS